MEMNRIIDRNACAYKEIYEILKIFPKELVNKIPKDKIEFFYNNMDRSYEYNITKETFDGQTMLEETAAILTILFRDYWASTEQKEKLDNFKSQAEDALEEEARIKYNPDNLFENRNKNNAENIASEQAIVEYKEPFYKRIINMIKELLMRR